MAEAKQLSPDDIKKIIDDKVPLLQPLRDLLKGLVDKMAEQGWDPGPPQGEPPGSGCPPNCYSVEQSGGLEVGRDWRRTISDRVGSKVHEARVYSPI